MGKDPLESLELNFRFVGSPGEWTGDRPGHLEVHFIGSMYIF